MTKAHKNIASDKSKPCLVISCGYTAGIERWLETCWEHVLSQVQPVIIMFKPHFDVPEGFTVIKKETQCQYDLERFIPLQEALLQLGLDRWYIWTDYADVYFQAALPSLIHPSPEIKAFVCPQDIAHRDTPFWRPFLSLEGFQILEDQPVYGLGCLAIQGRFFLDFINYLLMYKTFLRQHPLPVEQLFFNKWLYFHKGNIAEHESLCVALYASYTGDPSSALTRPPRARLVNNQFVNHRGAPYSIVHANGPTRDMLGTVRPYILHPGMKE